MRYQTLGLVSLLLLPVSILSTPFERISIPRDPTAPPLERRVVAQAAAGDYTKGDYTTEAYERLANQNIDTSPGDTIGDDKSGPVEKSAVGMALDYASSDTDTNTAERDLSSATGSSACSGCIDRLIAWLDKNRSSLQNLEPWEKANLTNWARAFTYFSEIADTGSYDSGTESFTGTNIPSFFSYIAQVTNDTFGGTSSGGGGGTSNSASGGGGSGSTAGSGSSAGSVLSSLQVNTFLASTPTGGTLTLTVYNSNSATQTSTDAGNVSPSTGGQIQTSIFYITSGILTEIVTPTSTTTLPEGGTHLYSVSYYSTDDTLTLTVQPNTNKIDWVTDTVTSSASSETDAGLSSLLANTNLFTGIGTTSTSSGSGSSGTGTLATTTIGSGSDASGTQTVTVTFSASTTIIGTDFSLSGTNINLGTVSTAVTTAGGTGSTTTGTATRAGGTVTLTITRCDQFKNDGPVLWVDFIDYKYNNCYVFGVYFGHRQRFNELAEHKYKPWGYIKYWLYNVFDLSLDYDNAIYFDWELFPSLYIY
ncbi:hypothetical protein ABW20_dc0100962 [Dactylellina cionopaga]|nr:hypothetical protein ABW20_dc0100962 [Dactylellina cionopaga]